MSSEKKEQKNAAKQYLWGYLHEINGTHGSLAHFDERLMLLELIDLSGVTFSILHFKLCGNHWNFKNNLYRKEALHFISNSIDID